MNVALGAIARCAPLQRAGKFGAVGIVGVAVNTLAQAACVELLGINYLIAAIIATQASTTCNFLIADPWVFEATYGDGGRRRRYVSFLAMSNATLVARVPMMWSLVDLVGMHYVSANFISLALLTVVRFNIADRVIWKNDREWHHPRGPLTRSYGTTTALESAHPIPPPVILAPVEAAGPKRELTLRAQWAIVGAIVLAGAFLRTWRLMAVGYNSDEAVYASQAAAIAGDRSIAEFFPIFRAHPVLFQAILSVPFRYGTIDAVGRLSSVVFGLATIVMVFVTGRRLYGARVGIIAAGTLALMPYHVIVTRQVLLDGPMTFFATLTLYFLVRFAETRRLAWLLSASCGLGLTTLAKETYVILVGSVFMFFALSPEIRLRLRDVVAAAGILMVVLLPFPITLGMAGKSDTGKSYLSWQLFRRPNHGLGFYPTTLPPFIGYAVLIGAAIALVTTWGVRRSWRERLLISWFLVPAVFLEVWPVKGFHYLLAASIALVILGAQGVSEVLDRMSQGMSTRATAHPGRSRRDVSRPYTALVLGVVAISLALPSWSAVQPTTADSLLAGSGGVPGGREVGEWIRANVPEGAEIMTVGPSMANLVQYYGRRRAYGLSVSPNPLNRNPSYVPVVNPDREIRTNNVQYLVWDSYSTNRSQFFGAKLQAYAERYHGREVYTFESAGRPVIIVYEVRP